MLAILFESLPTLIFATGGLICLAVLVREVPGFCRDLLHLEAEAAKGPPMVTVRLVPHGRRQPWPSGALVSLPPRIKLAEERPPVTAPDDLRAAA